MGARLSLHAGAMSATREEVLAVATPEPTETWQPVPHETLLTGVISRLESIGLNVRREQHGLQGEGNRWFGVFDLAARSGDKDYSLSVGLRNSHDQSMAAAAIMGANVWICDNQSFSGEVQFSRKHTSEILAHLPEILDRTVVKLSMLEDYQAIRFDHYKRTEISAKDADHLLVQAVMGRALPVTRLPKVYEEWVRPRHEEFAPRTAWSLFNAFTEIYKTTSPFALPLRSQRLHHLIDRTIGTPKLEAPATLTLAELQAKAQAAPTN